MNELDLKKELELSHKAVLELATAIYMYLGELISREDLHKTVKNILSENYIKLFEHRYILKDIYQTKTFDVYAEDAPSYINDVDELDIRE